MSMLQCLLTPWIYTNNSPSLIVLGCCIFLFISIQPGQSSDFCFHLSEEYS